MRPCEGAAAGAGACLCSTPPNQYRSKRHQLPVISSTTVKELHRNAQTTTVRGSEFQAGSPDRCVRSTTPRDHSATNTSTGGRVFQLKKRLKTWHYGTDASPGNTQTDLLSLWSLRSPSAANQLPSRPRNRPGPLPRSTPRGGPDHAFKTVFVVFKCYPTR